MIQSKLVAKKEQVDQLETNQEGNHHHHHHGGYGSSYSCHEGHHRQQSSSFDRRRERSHSSNSGDYRRQQPQYQNQKQQQQQQPPYEGRGQNNVNNKSRSNSGRGQGGHRHANTRHHSYAHDEPPPRRDWKEQARQSTLEKYSSIPGQTQTDGLSWMEQRILKQKQREKEENEKREELQRQREEEKKRKKLSQIEALKAALLMKQEKEPLQQEIKILKPVRKVERDESKGSKGVGHKEASLNSSEKMQESKGKSTTEDISSPPTSSLAKVSLGSSSLPASSPSSPPPSRPKLKLAPRTKPVPKQLDVTLDNRTAKPDDIQHDTDTNQRSSLAVAATENKKHSEKESYNLKSIKDSKSHSVDANNNRKEENECDDESQSNERSSSGAFSRGNHRPGYGRGGPGRKGGGRGSKKVYGRGHGGRHHDANSNVESTSGRGGGHPKESANAELNSEATTSSSNQHDQKHKWETKADGSVVLSRVRKDSVSSDRGRGRGRGKHKGRGRGRGRVPSSDSN
jgi:hypothetical protein